MNEQKYKDIYNYLDTSSYLKGSTNTEKEKINNQSKKYFIQQRQLFRRVENGNSQRVVLPDQTELILFNLHKDQIGAHLGIDVTYEKLKERYYWPKMYESVIQYIKSCDNCQRRGKPNRREELKPIKVGKPFHRIGIDIKGPLSVTKKGNRYIIVAMDYLTKWPEAKAIPNMKAETVAEFIYKEIICRHGVPEEILSDRGTSLIRNFGTLIEKKDISKWERQEKYYLSQHIVHRYLKEKDNYYPMCLECISGTDAVIQEREDREKRRQNKQLYEQKEREIKQEFYERKEEITRKFNRKMNELKEEFQNKI